MGRRSGDRLGARGQAGRGDSPPAGTRSPTPRSSRGAYRLSLSQRFEPRSTKSPELGTAVTRVTTTAPTVGRDGETRWTIRRPDGTSVVVRRHGLDVDIVDGAQADEVEPLLAMLRAAQRKAVPAPAATR